MSLAASVLVPTLIAGRAAASQEGVVVSQVYGGGGNIGAPLSHDFIELFNAGDAPVAVDGWSVQYASATGTGHFAGQVAAVGGTLEPGQRYLVQLATGGGGGDPLPTPDATGTFNMSATSGKVIVADTAEGLACNGGATPCTPEQLAHIVDLIGYGGANFFEGSGAAPALTNTTAALRNGNGCTDTDDNAADVSAAAPAPRNTASPLTPCDEPPPEDCSLTPTHEIADVQGAGAASPVVGEDVVIEGVVTGDFQAGDELSGFFMQDPTPDADPATSDGIFVFHGSTPVAPGDLVRVQGTATEFFDLTEISPASTVQVCDRGQAIDPTPVDLPVPPSGDVPYLERFEGVVVTFPETLTVTEHFQLGRFGEVTVSSDGRLFHPNNGQGDTVEENARRRLLIDDGSTVQNPPDIPYLEPEVVRLGDRAADITGVLSFGFSQYRLQPTESITFERDNPRPAAPADVAGDIRVAGFNTLNYFLDLGEDDSEARGADNAEELARQEGKLVPAITELDADIVGLMEIENDGAATVGNLVDLLNAAEGADVWDHIVEPVVGDGSHFGGTFGTDAIKVAFIYRPEAVTPVGESLSSADPVFDRPPLIQTFELAGGSEPFTLAVNHFKSKGCGGAEGDDLDFGQGCFNATRTRQAEALSGVLADLGVPNPLIMGDLNAYGEEDPIDTIEDAGYTSLSETFIAEDDRYSFVFNGESGELDHALASESLVDRITGAAIWHINADEPLILDYNTEFNPPGLYEPNAYRSSDHDPLIFGLELADAPQAPQDFQVVNGWHAATISWTAPDDGGSPLTGYTATAARGDEVIAEVALGPDATSHTFGGLDTGVTYTFEVVAMNEIGAGEAAGPVTATPFRPRPFRRLELTPVCGGELAVFELHNPNAFPVGFGWISAAHAGEGAVAAESDTTIEFPRPVQGSRFVKVFVDGKLHDRARAC